MGLTKNENIKVLFEFPKKWVDFDSPMGMLGDVFRNKLDDLLRDAVVEKVLKKMEIPKIKVTKEEIKDRMLSILAKRALDKDDE